MTFFSSVPTLLIDSSSIIPLPALDSAISASCCIRKIFQFNDSTAALESAAATSSPLLWEARRGSLSVSHSLNSLSDLHSVQVTRCKSLGTSSISQPKLTWSLHHKAVHGHAARLTPARPAYRPRAAI